MRRHADSCASAHERRELLAPRLPRPLCLWICLLVSPQYAEGTVLISCHVSCSKSDKRYPVKGRYALDVAASFCGWFVEVDDLGHPISDILGHGDHHPPECDRLILLPDCSPDTLAGMLREIKDEDSHRCRGEGRIREEVFLGFSLDYRKSRSHNPTGLQLMQT